MLCKILRNLKSLFSRLALSHSEEIHERTTDSKLNKCFAFSPDSLCSTLFTTSLNRALASAFMEATVALRSLRFFQRLFL